MTPTTDKELRALAEAVLEALRTRREAAGVGKLGDAAAALRYSLMSDEVDKELAATSTAFQRAAGPQTVIGLLDRIAAAEAKAERLEQQAAQWKGEDRGHKSSLHECYRAVTGGTGEPADWHGSRPVVECIEGLRSQLEEAKAALAPFAGKLLLRAHEGWESSERIKVRCTVGDLRRAAEAGGAE